MIEFYPKDFKIDLNGKKFANQGVTLLPSMNVARLRDALKPLRNLLTEEESMFII